MSEQLPRPCRRQRGRRTLLAEDAGRRLEVFIRAAPAAVELDDREISLYSITDLLKEPRTGPA